MTIKIMLAEDHAILRAGLQSLLEREKDMEIVGQVENGHQAVDLAAELKPDVIIMDVTMPDMNGIEATRLIRAANPEIKVIALSAFDNPDFVLGMVRAGASGYLLKDNLFEDLLRAIQAVTQGQSYLCSEVAAVVVDAYQEDRISLSQLKEPEIELIRLLVQGHSARDIGDRQGLSVKTVEGRRRRLLKKLNIDSIAELVQFAIENGLLSGRNVTNPEATRTV